MTESLAGSRSPFLQHGARQPVAWLPWGAAAFERARQLDRPILLDIGAVWCHWCHVMDRESYEDTETARLINERFVPVKVDRDERPDIDARYQRAVQTLTGQGGWPLTAFLTPDGETFYGGTYFPPDDRYGRPSFRRVLGEVARLWGQERPRALAAVSSINERLHSYAQAEIQPADVQPELVTATVEEFAQSFDFRFGGFGRAPKFPNAGGLQLLLDHALETGLDWSRRMVEETLEAMACGGVYDQLGGGFHRYSVDARWIIPHFEKMAYDNGPLLEVCARAAALYNNPLLAHAAHGVVQHHFDVAGTLLERGGFPASQDADYSPEDDGDYWTWTFEELETALNDESLLHTAVLYFGLQDPAGSMHLDPQRHVLFQAMRPVQLQAALQITDAELEDRLQHIHERLKRARDQRPRPFVDETLYTGWNGLVASGFLAAARHLDNGRAGAAALRALEHIWQLAFNQEYGLAHRAGDREAGEHLDDHAHMTLACLDAFEYTQELHWLERTLALAQLVERNFLHPNGAYRDRPAHAASDTASLAEPTFSIADAPVPSGNGAMALALLRLAALNGDDTFARRAQRVLGAFAGAAPRLGTAAATYVRAVAWATQPITTVVVVGTDSTQSNALWQTALRAYRPRLVVRRLAPHSARVETLPEPLVAMMTGEPDRAYVCLGSVCRAPITDPQELAAALRAQANGSSHADT